MSLYEPVNFYNDETDNIEMLNIGLDQGLNFQNEQKKNIHSVGLKRLNLIEKTTSDNLGNIEGMTNNDNYGEEKPEVKKLNELEQNFNDKLSLYSSIYKEYLTKLSNSKDNALLYANTNVKDSNGKIYVVNKYGVARGYNEDTWKNKHSSCPTNVPGDDTVKIFNQLKIGVDKAKNEPCNLEGNVIRTLSPLRNAWVTPDGKKRWFPDTPTWKAGLKNGCNPNPIVVSNEIYEAMAHGDNMTTTSKCSPGDEFNPGFHDMKNELEKLNGELIDIANEIYEQVITMNKQNDRLNTGVEQTKNELKRQITRLEKQRVDFNKLQSQQDSLQAEYQDNQLLIDSSYYQYIIWTLLAITLGIVAVRHMTN